MAAKADGALPGKRDQLMTSTPSIRMADCNDIVPIKSLVQATGLFPPEMLADMIRGYLEGHCDDLWFVCDNGEGISSFGFCEPERMTEGTWNLSALAVSPDLQGQGVGAAMVAFIEETLFKKGERILLIETMGTPAFERTRAFYAKNGYTKEARIRDFYEEGGDKVIFWKRLGQCFLERE